MARLVAPNDTMREVEIQGAYTGRKRRYGWQKDGTVHVDSAADIKALRDAGFTVAGVASAGARGGYVCSGCGFHSFFRLCGRCGSEGVKQ